MLGLRAAQTQCGPMRYGRPGTLAASPLKPRADQPSQLASWHALQPASRPSVAAYGAPAATDAEAAANEKRREEAGNVGSSDEWRWTLNWDKIEDNIIVGSCPRSPSDVDRLVDEAGISAIICLQSEICHDALQIEWEPIRRQAIQRGALMTRVAVRDFDHGDQALMLPEAVRMLHLLLSMGKRVYVHCTAGINRATLTVVGYLTFVRGWPLEDAVNHVKHKRPQAHPYIDCWQTVKARLTEGRTEELMGLAKAVYRGRQHDNRPGSSQGDWASAERLLLQEQFTRGMGCTLSLVSTFKELQEVQLDSLCAESSQGAELERLHSQLDLERSHLQQAAKDLEAAREEVAMLRQAAAFDELGSEMLAELDALKSARLEIAALRTAIHQVAQAAMKGMEGEASPSVDSRDYPSTFLEPGHAEASMKAPAIGA